MPELGFESISPDSRARVLYCAATLYDLSRIQGRPPKSPEPWLILEGVLPASSAQGRERQEEGSWTANRRALLPKTRQSKALLDVSVMT